MVLGSFRSCGILSPCETPPDLLYVAVSLEAVGCRPSIVQACKANL